MTEVSLSEAPDQETKKMFDVFGRYVHGAVIAPFERYIEPSRIWFACVFMHEDRRLFWKAVPEVFGDSLLCTVRQEECLDILDVEPTWLGLFAQWTSIVATRQEETDIQLYRRYWMPDGSSMNRLCRNTAGPEVPASSRVKVFGHREPLKVCDHQARVGPRLVSSEFFACYLGRRKLYYETMRYGDLVLDFSAIQ